MRRVQLEEFYSVQDPLCVLCRQGVIRSPRNLHDQIMQLTSEYQFDGVRVLCMEYYCDFCHVLFDASVLAQYLSLRRFLRSIPAECLPSYIFREWSCSIVQFINHTLQEIPIHPREPFIPPHHELNLGLVLRVFISSCDRSCSRWMDRSRFGPGPDHMVHEPLLFEGAEESTDQEGVEGSSEEYETDGECVVVEELPSSGGSGQGGTREVATRRRRRAEVVFNFLSGPVPLDRRVPPRPRQTARKHCTIPRPRVPPPVDSTSLASDRF